MPEKKLKPSLRENKRYLLLETKANKKEIETAILSFLGTLGYAKSGIFFISEKIIAVDREQVDKVRASLALCPVLIKVKKISGTLKKLRS